MTISTPHLNPPLLARTNFDCDPIDALLADDGNGVMAVIIGVEGPSYRPVGTVMAILTDGSRIGTLSSGCVEGDLALHAQQSLLDGKPRKLRYGAGSPFFDIRLPCGGGLDILLVPRPDLIILQQLHDMRRQRQLCTLAINTEKGLCYVTGDDRQSGIENDIFYARFQPQVRFLIFGKGPEASTFAALVHSVHYPNVLLSPDEETLCWAQSEGVETIYIQKPEIPRNLFVDQWTAIVLFFHDHDWEPNILKSALISNALYIGAQGSRRARDARYDALRNDGVSEADIARLHGPIGLIPSTRDPRTLAVSVLAEILMEAA